MRRAAPDDAVARAGRAGAEGMGPIRPRPGGLLIRWIIIIGPTGEALKACILKIHYVPHPPGGAVPRGHPTAAPPHRSSRKGHDGSEKTATAQCWAGAVEYRKNDAGPERALEARWSGGRGPVSRRLRRKITGDW